MSFERVRIEMDSIPEPAARTMRNTACCALIILVFLAWDVVDALVAESGATVSRPREGVRRIELRELWRTGADDTGVIFGVVGNAMLMPDGGIAVLDYQQGIVFVFSRDGRLEREIDVSGEGPGKSNSPSDPIRLADGRIAFAQCFPPRIEVLDADWQYSESIPLYNRSGDEELRLENLIAYRDGFLIVGEHIKKVREGRNFLMRRINYVTVLSATGELGDPVYSSERVVDFSNHVYIEDELHYVRSVAVGAADEIYVPTKRNGYEITVFGPDGEPQAVLTRDYAPLERTEDKIRYLEAHYHTIFERSYARYRIEVSKYEPDISWLEYDESGELRVTTSRSYRCSDPGVFCRYDIFGPQGHFIRQDDIILPTVEHCGGRLRWLGDGRLMLITGLVASARGMDMAKDNTQKALAELDDDSNDKPMEIVIYEIAEVSERGM